MALEREIERGWALLTLDVPALREDGSIPMRFIVESDEATTIVVVPESEVINDPDLKSGVAKKVRKLVAEMGAHTVYHLSDAWTSQVDNVKQKPELLRLIQNIGVRRASELGLVKLSEALMCSISTRSGEHALLRWFYRRDDEQQITMGERDKLAGAGKGRFSNLFQESV
jgi:hypothetical protein